MRGNTSIVVESASNGWQTLRLAGDINVFVAAEFHAHAVQLASGNEAILVECTDVCAFDAAALQVLVALKDSLALRGRPFRMAGLSREVRETIGLAGLADRLAISEEPSSAESSRQLEVGCSNETIGTGIG